MSQSNNMDPFDEFEFKPLTEGLGFHKEAVSLKEELKSSGVLQDQFKVIPASVPQDLLESSPKTNTKTKRTSFEDVLTALEKTPLQMTEPLPREIEPVQAKRTPVQSPFPPSETFKTPQPKPNSKTPGGSPAAATKPMPTPTSDPGTRRGAADSPKVKRLEPATISLASAFLDLVIVSALSLIFMVALLMVTKVDLNVVIHNLTRDIMTQVSLGLMFLAVMQMYVVISRSFFGRTLGEWTFDLQLGADNEQKSEIYPLRIALRSLVVTLTGVILLPLLSALIGRDIAGHIAGVRLYRQGL